MQRYAIVLVLCVGLAGCGSDLDTPPLATVSGTVTLDGKPLVRGTVQFAPDRSLGTEGPSGLGMIDANGHYEIITAGSNGAMIGFHRVGVVSEEEVDLSQTSYAPSLIPEIYASPDTSGLTYEVKEIDNTIDIKLVSQP